MEQWFIGEPVDYLWVGLSSCLLYFYVIMLARVFGHRSLSSMSSFDFLVTITTGSVLALGMANRQVPTLMAALAVLVLFALQELVAKLKRATNHARPLLERKPLILMKDGKVLEKNLATADLTRPELMATLRRHGIIHLQQVSLVVVEVNGSISVLRDDPEIPLQDELLLGVKQEDDWIGIN